MSVAGRASLGRRLPAWLGSTARRRRLPGCAPPPARGRERRKGASESPRASPGAREPGGAEGKTTRRRTRPRTRHLSHRTTSHDPSPLTQPSASARAQRTMADPTASGSAAPATPAAALDAVGVMQPPAVAAAAPADSPAIAAALPHDPPTNGVATPVRPSHHVLSARATPSRLAARRASRARPARRSAGKGEGPATGGGRASPLRRRVFCRPPSILDRTLS